MNNEVKFEYEWTLTSDLVRRVIESNRKICSDTPEKVIHDLRMYFDSSPDWFVHDSIGKHICSFALPRSASERVRGMACDEVDKIISKYPSVYAPHFSQYRDIADHIFMILRRLDDSDRSQARL